MSVLFKQRPAARLSNIEFIDNADKRPAWLSADGTTVYSWGLQRMYYSTDDGTTWTASTFNAPFSSMVVHGVRETADGELLISVFKAQGFNSTLYRSTGWTANKATATWTEVLSPSGQAPTTAGLDTSTWPAQAGTSGDRSNYFTSWFGFQCYGDGTVIVNEYGKQCNGSTIPGARNVFVSTDNGKTGTWRLLRDMFTGPAYGFSDWTPGRLPFGPAAGGEHMHGATYDPYQKRYWFTAGDHGHHTEYSDDGGATWRVTAASQVEFGGQGAGLGSSQCVTPFAFPDRIVMGSDGPLDGLIRYSKSTGAAVADIAHDLGLPHTSNLKYTLATPFTRDALRRGFGSLQFPVVFPFYVGAGTTGTWPAVIVVSDPLGERFYEVWTDNQTLGNPYGVFTAMGPTANGKLLASIALDGRSAGQSSTAGYTMLRADFPAIV